MRNGFVIDLEEHRKINEWVKSHPCTITYEGAIGGKYTYCFTPTGIGTALKVKCACGAEVDATDYDSW